VRRNLRFVLTDPEPANFTYELANQDELGEWAAAVCGCEPGRADALIAEAQTDAELASRLRQATAGHRWWSKPAPPFGKRLAWYAIARTVKPQLAIETGVHDGLGSLLLLRALERNQAEGAPGRLVSFDVNPAAGWLVQPRQHPLWELRIEPATTGLPEVLAAAPPLGVLIHDSLHTYENERAEFELAVPHLAENGVLISDNAHGTRALPDVCSDHGLLYAEFHERSRDHFYPGGATGAGWAAPPGDG
jgi:hypothetical protein